MKIFITVFKTAAAAAAVPSPSQGAANTAGISIIATLINGVQSRLASREKKAKVLKCRKITGAVVIWQATVMAQMSMKRMVSESHHYNMQVHKISKIT